MTKPNPRLDPFFRNAKAWRQEFAQLRVIALDSGLTEQLKWRLPCYSLENANVAILQGFRDYCAIMFFKGALLKDPKGILVAPGASQAGRQVRFTDVGEIARLRPVLKAYLREAIEVEKAGMQVKLKKTSDFAIPVEFQKKLDANPALKKAFHALTPGRQRGYLFYFADAKQSATRAARVQKCVPRILAGKGLND
jgi:uncharacterized protein YdeI (YjbR/CyaY-like superfamily)